MANVDNQTERETFLLEDTPNGNGVVEVRERTPPQTKRAIIKNLLVISLAFLFLFTAFQSLQVCVRICFVLLLLLMLLILWFNYVLLVVLFSCFYLFLFCCCCCYLANVRYSNHWCYICLRIAHCKWFIRQHRASPPPPL